jgi:hypothetical protein
MSGEDLRPHDRRRYRRGCRCGECRADWAAYWRDYKQRPGKFRKMRHGEAKGYYRGCRCDRCVRAHRLYRRLRYRFGESISDPAGVLTDPLGPAFLTLVELVFPPHVRAAIHQRAVARYEAEKIGIHSYDGWAALMQPDIPTRASTHRASRARGQKIA